MPSVFGDNPSEHEIILNPELMFRLPPSPAPLDIINAVYTTNISTNLTIDEKADNEALSAFNAQSQTLLQRLNEKADGLINPSLSVVDFKHGLKMLLENTREQYTLTAKERSTTKEQLETLFYYIEQQKNDAYLEFSLILIDDALKSCGTGIVQYLENCRQLICAQDDTLIQWLATLRYEILLEFQQKYFGQTNTHITHKLIQYANNKGWGISDIKVHHHNDRNARDFIIAENALALFSNYFLQEYNVNNIRNMLVNKLCDKLTTILSNDTKDFYENKKNAENLLVKILGSPQAQIDFSAIIEWDDETFSTIINKDLMFWKNTGSIVMDALLQQQVLLISSFKEITLNGQTLRLSWSANPSFHLEFAYIVNEKTAFNKDFLISTLVNALEKEHNELEQKPSEALAFLCSLSFSSISQTLINLYTVCPNKAAWLLSAIINLHTPVSIDKKEVFINKLLCERSIIPVEFVVDCILKSNIATIQIDLDIITSRTSNLNTIILLIKKLGLIFKPATNDNSPHRIISLLMQQRPVSTEKIQFLLDPRSGLILNQADYELLINYTLQSNGQLLHPVFGRLLNDQNNFNLLLNRWYTQPLTTRIPLCIYLLKQKNTPESVQKIAEIIVSYKPLDNQYLSLILEENVFDWVLNNNLLANPIFKRLMDGQEQKPNEFMSALIIKILQRLQLQKNINPDEENVIQSLLRDYLFNNRSETSFYPYMSSELIVKVLCHNPFFASLKPPVVGDNNIPLSFYINNNTPPIVAAFILNLPGMLFESSEHPGRSALISMISNKVDFKIINMMIKKIPPNSAFLNIQDHSHRTALYYALSIVNDDPRRAKLCEALYQAGATVSGAINANGESLLTAFLTDPCFNATPQIIKPILAATDFNPNIIIKNTATELFLLAHLIAHNKNALIKNLLDNHIDKFSIEHISAALVRLDARPLPSAPLDTRNTWKDQLTAAKEKLVPTCAVPMAAIPEPPVQAAPKPPFEGYLPFNHLYNKAKKRELERNTSQSGSSSTADNNNTHKDKKFKQNS